MRILSPLSLILLLIASSTFGQFGSPVPMYPMEMDGYVNMANHRYIRFSVTDIAVPGRGLGISFTRYYNERGENSRNHTPSYIGYNARWTHNYHWQIRQRSNLYGRGEEYYIVRSGNGAEYTFKLKPRSIASLQWPFFEPEPGTQGQLKIITHNGTFAFIYTTKHGDRYQFEPYGMQYPFSTDYYVLTEIASPNGNRISLHYEQAPDTYNEPRLVAVEDTVGRILKFYYEISPSEDSNASERYYKRVITKIEFGVGTPQVLATVFNTIRLGYGLASDGLGNNNRFRLTSVTHELGAEDPRGTELVTQYEYDNIDYKVNAIVHPTGLRTEFWGGTYNRVVRVKEDSSALHLRRYRSSISNGSSQRHRNLAYDIHAEKDLSVITKRNSRNYQVSNGRVTGLNRLTFADPPADGGRASIWPTYISTFYWDYDNHRNITAARYLNRSDSQYKWRYKIYYEGTNADHNKQMGNPTKWEQLDPTNSSTVLRKWEADYETTYNKPIWQIDAMGHKTEFTYDSKGNLTETRSKANTGTQAHAVDHDIVTTHEYDAYGNRIKTTFMPGTSQEQVVETVYDSTYHTYPVEVKTTVTVDGAVHIIRTRSEWDVNRGRKTADIDAMGKRTEYAYWQDGKLKYTRRVADDLYTVPTYDKGGNVTQTQVRQTNWETGTLIAQTNTEYDGMGRAVKGHSFNDDDWTTAYATTETTYNIFGYITQTKDPRGLITTYEHDKHGKVTKQTLPDGDWVETRYNVLDQITKAWTSQTGTETTPAISHTYDDFNRLLTTTYSTGETISHTYDRGDNPLTITTNDGTETYTHTNTYDQLNRPVTHTDSLLGYKMFYEYNDSGNRARMHIQKSTGGSDLYDVSYTYDEASRLLSVTDALASKTASYAYFDIGALKTSTNPNGITTHRTLDTLNRLDTLQYKKTATDILASLDYDYDVKSNVTQLVRDDTGAGGASQTFTFGYDDISRLTSANYGDETVSYTYDKVGNRLTLVSTVDGTTTYTIATDSNQLTHRSLVPEDSDFDTMSYTYDAEGKLTERSEGTDSDAFSYTQFGGGKLTQIEQTRGGSVTQTVTYSYDGAGRRVKVVDSTGTRYFFYDGGMPVLELDSDKNITAAYLYGADGVVYRRKHSAVAHWHFDEGNGSVARDVDGQNNGTLGDGNSDATPAWSSERGGSLLFDGVDDAVKVADSDGLDLVGDVLTISCWLKRSSATSGYLLKKSDSSNGYRLWVTASGTLQFELDFDGTAKTVTSTTTIPLDQWSHLSARYDGSELRVFIDGTIEAATTAVTGSLSATSEALWLGYYDDTDHHFDGYLDEVSIYARALSDAEIENLSDNQAGRYEYHHTNALGSNIVLTDDNQNVLVRYEYDVFGAIRSETGTSDNVRKFTGKEWDADVNLYYYAARYYDPYIGRFTSRDPSAQGLNWYLYTDNNPLTRIDRDGRFWETIVDIFGAGLSFYDFVKAPGWGTGAVFVYDLGAVFVPFVPGTGAGRIVAKVATKVKPSKLKKAFKGVTKFNADNARQNLQRLTHGEHGKHIMKGYDAHHIIPTKVHQRLEEMGSKINPNEPQFLTWWKNSKYSGTHQNYATEINKRWDEFLDLNPNASDDEILDFAHTIAEDYKQHYWNQQYYFELYQETTVSPSQLDN